MSDWYRRVCASYEAIPDLITEYEKEIIDAKRELKLTGITLEQHASRMPGIVEHRYSQLQEIEAILEYMNLQLKRKRAEKFKHFTHGYEKVLSSRDAEKYIDADDDVIDLTILINDVALLRNQFLSIHKGLDIKHWQISNVIKLRVAGLEDATVTE